MNWVVGAQIGFMAIQVVFLQNALAEDNEIVVVVSSICIILAGMFIGSSWK